MNYNLIVLVLHRTSRSDDSDILAREAASSILTAFRDYASQRNDTQMCILLLNSIAGRRNPVLTGREISDWVSELYASHVRALAARNAF